MTTPKTKTAKEEYAEAFNIMLENKKREGYAQCEKDFKRELIIEGSTFFNRGYSQAQKEELKFLKKIEQFEIKDCECQLCINLRERIAELKHNCPAKSEQSTSTQTQEQTNSESKLDSRKGCSGDSCGGRFKCPSCRTKNEWVLDHGPSCKLRGEIK